VTVGVRSPRCAHPTMRPQRKWTAVVHPTPLPPGGATPQTGVRSRWSPGCAWAEARRPGIGLQVTPQPSVPFS